MTKELLKAKAADIFEMNETELIEFGEEVSRSFLDDKSKMYLYRVIEDRQLQIRTADEMENACVVCSEIKEGEL